jgi:hypothetical protein
LKARLGSKGFRSTTAPGGRLGAPIRRSEYGEEVTLMPQKEHLPRVSDKEQRMYEHIKKSELEAGRSKDKAKAIAAATVVKHHNQDDHPSGR